MYMDDETLRRVERYRYQAELPTRAAAIRALLAGALKTAGIPRMPAKTKKK